MQVLPRDFDRYYTLDDYFNLPDGNRYELIDGVLYAMGSPGADHQEIRDTVSSVLVQYFQGKPCKVYTAPFDVILNNSRAVQPDILVLCDRKKLEETGRKRIKGAPDFIIEIWSESTGRYDLMGKRLKYQEAGVKEYWVIMNVGLVYVYLLDDKGFYYETIYYARNGEDIEIPVTAFPELKIKLGKFIHEWAV